MHSSVAVHLARNFEIAETPPHHKVVAYLCYLSFNAEVKYPKGDGSNSLPSRDPTSDLASLYSDHCFHSQSPTIAEIVPSALLSRRLFTKIYILRCGPEIGRASCRERV